VPRDFALPSPSVRTIDVTLRDIPVNTLTGEPSSLADGDLAGKTLLVVNVASKCGLTPQYAGLEALHERFADQGFAVVGFPCNQFGGQEPGTAEQIAEFCSTTYGVSFPMFEKIEVNGDGRHPIYTELTAVADAEGQAGDVQWNFEKFLVGPDGSVLGRFRPMTAPDAAELVSAVEGSLAG
jgi:glutathione peroxidase